MYKVPRGPPAAGTGGGDQSRAPPPGRQGVGRLSPTPGPTAPCQMKVAATPFAWWGPSTTLTSPSGGPGQPHSQAPAFSRGIRTRTCGHDRFEEIRQHSTISRPMTPHQPQPCGTSRRALKRHPRPVSDRIPPGVLQPGYLQNLNMYYVIPEYFLPVSPFKPTGNGITAHTGGRLGQHRQNDGRARVRARPWGLGVGGGFNRYVIM